MRLHEYQIHQHTDAILHQNYQELSGKGVRGGGEGRTDMMSA
jgi:hypothetical protein